MFLLCLDLCFIIFRNPHAQNAWVTQKKCSYCSPISSHVTVRATDIKSTADWIHVKPKGNCDGILIWGTHDAIFNRISLKLELKKSSINFEAWYFQSG